MKPKFVGSTEEEVKSKGEQILSTLVEKLGDNLVKTRKAAEEAILAMSRN